VLSVGWIAQQPSAAAPTRLTSPGAGFAPSAAPSSNGQACREQPAQGFLLRQHQLAKPRASLGEQQQILEARARANRYRTERYGYFPGFGRREDNPHPPRYYAEVTTFMGFSVTLHRKVIPALRCVEQALLTDCLQVAYRPDRVTGLRLHNTYLDYEISNHVYGIALDIDPDHNTCCGCVAPWNEHSLCRKPVKSIFERMRMPECWVNVFERYGFHWLGRDELEDTMHFEFLGDPDRILG
jgi:hypothetical protein